MSEVKAWCTFATPDPIMPRDKNEFTGYMISRFKVEEVVSGRLPGTEGQSTTLITLKGEMPSLSPMFRYLLRFQRVPANKRGKYDTDDTYDLLPRAGFVKMERAPWTREQLVWALCNEAKCITLHKARALASRVVSVDPQGEGDGKSVEERMKEIDPAALERLMEKSEYYRLDMVVLLRLGWPRKTAEIRAMKTEDLRECIDRLERAPWEMCFYKFTKGYELGEMGIAGLTAVSEFVKVPVAPVVMAAVRLYDFIKSQKLRYGHTIFSREQILEQFKRHPATPPSAGDIATAALMWLARGEHLLFINGKGETVHDQAMWFSDAEPIKDLQLPSDEALKLRILGHLRRIHANFVASKGNFTMRPCQDNDMHVVPSVPKGALNTKQREAIDHVLNNWLTVIQGAPGSGKTAVGITHVSTIFHWIEVLTHVGRQANALCDLLGGSTENARTIHSNYHRLSKSALYQEYAGNKEVLILDEVYNADDWTFEKALAAAPEASRLILVGDPDQIRPIPDEKGAGTPALDIANAFPQHVIYLDENMRQRNDARQIYSVVTAIRKKQPKSIDWSRDLNGDSAAVLLTPVGGTSGILTEITRMIQRLRSDLAPHEIGTGREHSWQLITFYNGNDPEKQGDGVDQLNGHVETFLERSGFFSPGGRVDGRPARKRHAVTTRLSMYEGFKFMFTAKFLPNIGELKQRRETKNKSYSEVFNGQIEVVQQIHQLKLPKVKGVVWEVVCWPRSSAPGAKGTRFLIHRGLHVDPAKIVPAWAVTSNKSMGGECENVGVFVPPGIERSLFDRSNIYVAFSRPTRFLGVIGQPRDIEAMILCDPKPIRSGLFSLVDATAYYSYSEQGERLSWKAPATQDCQMTTYVREQMGNVYDQTHRTPPIAPIPVCKIPWLTYLAIKKAQRKKFPHAQIKRMEHMASARYYGRLYRDEPRPVRPTDSMFDPEVPPELLEDPNALLMFILAKGAFAPIRPQDEEEEAEDIGPPRVEILDDDEEDDEEEGMDFDLPGSPERTQIFRSSRPTLLPEDQEEEEEEEERGEEHESATKKIKL